MGTIVLQVLSGLGGALLGVIASLVGAWYSSRREDKKNKIAYEKELREKENLYLQKLDEAYIANARLHIDALYIPLNISLTKLADSYGSFRRSWEFYDMIHKEDEEELIKVCWQFVSEISELFAQGKDVFLTTELESALNSFTNFLDRELTDNKLYNIPIYWIDFGAQLTTDIKTLKTLIREVTLGTNSALMRNRTAATKEIEPKQKDEEAVGVTLTGVPDF